MNRRQFLKAGTGSLIAPMVLCAKTLNLKITGLKTFVVNVGSVNWAFCKVYTNQGLVMENERFLLGKDHRHRDSVARHVPQSEVARRADSQLRHQRHRDRALGHPRAGSRSA